MHGILYDNRKVECAGIHVVLHAKTMECDRGIIHRALIYCTGVQFVLS